MSYKGGAREAGSPSAFAPARRSQPDIGAIGGTRIQPLPPIEQYNVYTNGAFNNESNLVSQVNNSSAFK